MFHLPEESELVNLNCQKFLTVADPLLPWRIHGSVTEVMRLPDLIESSGEQTVDLNALIAEMEAFVNPGEVFDTLMGLRDDVRVEDAKLIGLNDLIAQAEKEIKMKEALNMVFAMSFFSVWICMFPLGPWQRSELCLLNFPVLSEVAVTLGELETLLGRAQIYIYTISLKLLSMDALYILDKLAEVANSSRLQDKIKSIFVHARGADESFIALIRDLCSALRVSIAKNQRLIAELEALGQPTKASNPLDYMKEMVVRDFAMLGVLEQLLAGTHVVMRLKANYVAAMEETE
ncbi:hypothetical protein Tco_1346529 [Tanacetum coccineum]